MAGLSFSATAKWKYSIDIPYNTVTYRNNKYEIVGNTFTIGSENSSVTYTLNVPYGYVTNGNVYQIRKNEETGNVGFYILSTNISYIITFDSNDIPKTASDGITTYNISKNSTTELYSFTVENITYILDLSISKCTDGTIAKIDNDKFTIDNKEYTIKIDSSSFGDLSKDIATLIDESNIINNSNPPYPRTVKLDLISYFGIPTQKTKKLIWDASGIDYVYMKNGQRKKLLNIPFSSIPTLYDANDNPAYNIFLSATGNYSLLLSEQYICINPKFILVFIDGKYSYDWECIDSMLILKTIPKRSIEIYLLSNYDYNLQDQTHYYKKDAIYDEETGQYAYPDNTSVPFTFNNLRKNQFIEHHLKSTESFIIGSLGIGSFIEKNEISTRLLVRFSKTDFKLHNLIRIVEVVQNQSETYEDIIVRKKLCEQDTPWSKDFSLWKGVEDIFGTSNNSSTLIFDDTGHLIDPKSIDWFNKRLAPYESYEYVEIQHPENRVYTGEIYYPSATHNPEEHIEHDPLNEYRYKQLYQTNYKLVHLAGNRTYEYDTYFRKNFEILHLEETAYIKEYPSTKKGENLLLNDILLNNIYQNDDSLDEDAHIVRGLTSVQIQAETGYVRNVICVPVIENHTEEEMEIISTRLAASNINSTLNIEVPKIEESMLVFVDGKKLIPSTTTKNPSNYSLAPEKTYSTIISKNKKYVKLNQIFADEQEHVVNVFYPNLKNLDSHFLANLGSFDRNSTQFLKFSEVFQRYGYITIYIIDNIYSKISSVIGFISFNDVYGTLNEDEINASHERVYGALAPYLGLGALAHKPSIDGSLVTFKINDNYIDSMNDDYDNRLNATDGTSVLDRVAAKYLDYYLACFDVLNENNDTVHIEVPLSCLLTNPVFNVLDMEFYIFNDNANAACSISIDHTSFNSISQSFSFNNLRKNIYMEHYGNIVTYHILDAFYISDINEGIVRFHKSDKIYYRRYQEFDLSVLIHFIVNSVHSFGYLPNGYVSGDILLPERYEFVDYASLSDTDNLPYNGIRITFNDEIDFPEMDSSLETRITFTNLVDISFSHISNSLIRMCEFRGVLNNFDTVDNNLYFGSIPVRNFINDSLSGLNEKIMDHCDWVVDSDNFTVSYSFPFLHNFPENIQIFITETELPITDKGLVIYNDSYISTERTRINLESIEDYEKIMLEFEPNESYYEDESDYRFNMVTVKYVCNSLEKARLVRNKLIQCYVYCIERDLDLSNDYDVIWNNVYKLEQEMNRFSSMLFDKSGYLISPDSIDWVFNEFNYPMYDNQISILPLNSTYPAVIGEVYDNALEREQIMNLCLDDVIMIDNELKDIGNGLTNESYVPIDYDLQDIQKWLYLCNNDYVYWLEYIDENEDIMKIHVNQDDYIDNNVFCFINGIKVSDEDFEKNDARCIYRVKNFSKYKTERYKFKKYSKIFDNERIVYIQNSMFTFDESNTVVKMNDDSLFAKAEFADINDIIPDDNLVVKTDLENSREIVVFNYNPDDIQYVVKEQQEKYVFPDYYAYDLRRYALVFINGIREKAYVVNGNEIVLDLKPTDKLEIYVFKKYDYNWIDEVRYQQYTDSRIFYVHNLKTLRVV